MSVISLPADRLRGRTLLWARTAWFVSSTLAFYSFFRAIPSRGYQLLSINWLHKAHLMRMGLGEDFIQRYVSILDLLTFSIFAGIGIALFLFKSNHRMALYTSSMLLFMGTALTRPADSLSAIPPSIRGIYLFSIAMGFALVVLFLNMFPEGAFNPKWLRYPALLSALWPFIWYLLPAIGKSHLAWPPENQPILVALLIIGGAVGAQVYRYRRISNREQREQTRWFITGLLIGAAGFFGFVYVTPLLNPGVLVASQDRLLYVLVGVPLLYLTMLAIPITLGISILRHQLWDVDVILNKTVVYIALTGILAGLYAATIKLFQAVFVTATGNESDFSIILTTLTLASVFTPIKNTLQAMVDRRFKEADKTEASRIMEEEEDLLNLTDQQRLEQCTDLLNRAVMALDASSGAIYWMGSADAKLLHSQGNWDGVEEARAPVHYRGKPLGWIAIGPPKSRVAYSANELEFLQKCADRIAVLMAGSKRFMGSSSIESMGIATAAASSSPAASTN